MSKVNLSPTTPFENTSRPHVIIIGAGFGGLQAAKTLANKPVNVTLIDKHNYHLFQPLLYQVATAGLGSVEIASSIRQVLRHAKNIRVFMDEVTSIHKDQNAVCTKSDRCMKYDHLIIATGARHSYFGKDEWAPIAPGIKTINDAFNVRKKILTAFEMAEMSDSERDKSACLNFVIIGGGPTGVEMAGAIAELARKAMPKDFRHIDSKMARIILVDAGPCVLRAFNPKLSAKAHRHLEELGVEIVLNTRINDIGEDYAVLGDETIPTKTVIWAAGVQASPAAKWLDVEADRTGRVIVNNRLNIADHSNIYIVGDTAAFTPYGAEMPLPGVAPVAKQMGSFAAKSILSSLNNTPIKPFKYKDYGSMATIGRNKAIADIKGLKISGYFGWLLWCVVHIYYLAEFRNRVIVGLKWLWSYLTWERGVRLISGTSDDVSSSSTDAE